MYRRKKIILQNFVPRQNRSVEQKKNPKIFFTDEIGTQRTENR